MAKVILLDEEKAEIKCWLHNFFLSNLLKQPHLQILLVENKQKVNNSAKCVKV